MTNFGDGMSPLCVMDYQQERRGKKKTDRLLPESIACMVHNRSFHFSYDQVWSQAPLRFESANTGLVVPTPFGFEWEVATSCDQK